MSLQSTQRRHRQIATDKQHTVTTFNTNNSLALSQTIQDADDVQHLYCERRQSIEVQKHREPMLYSYKQAGKAAQQNICQIVLNSITQKQVESMVKAIQIISFLTRQAAEQKLLIKVKQNRINKLRNRIKITEEGIKIQKKKFEEKAKSYRERSDSVKQSKKRKMKRFNTQIASMRQEIDLMKRKLSCPKQTKNVRIASKRSSLRNYTQSCQQKIYIPLPPAHYPQYSPSPYYQEIFEHQSPNPENIPIFKRTSQRNPNKEQPITSQRSSQSNKQRQFQNNNIFDLLGQKLQRKQSQNHLAVPSSQTEGLKDIKSQQNKSIRIKKSNSRIEKSKKSFIFDQSSVKINCQQTNSYSLQQSISSEIPKKEKPQMQQSNALSVYFPSHLINDFKISNLGESVESKYTSTQRLNVLPAAAGKKKSKVKKSVRFHDSVEGESDMNADDIVLTSKSKFSKDSNYLPSSLHNSRRVDSQGSGFGQLHLTSQSIAPIRRQTQHMRQSSNIKIIQ